VALNRPALGVDPILHTLRAPSATQRYTSASQVVAALRQVLPHRQKARNLVLIGFANEIR
jgi:hypothetical protein